MSIVHDQGGWMLGDFCSAKGLCGTGLVQN